MSFICRYTVGVRTYSEDGEDPRGNRIETWSDPVSTPVYGWGPPQSAEPDIPGHDRVTVDLELYVPPGFRATAHDKIVLEGEEFDVVGRPADYGHGPFGYNPGAVVKLTRTEG